jgi:16S rRNA (cytosine967-C5)-methyltransferase
LPTKTSKHFSPKISPARRAAFDILRRVEQHGAYTSILLAAKAEELQPNDRAFAHELVMGVLRRQLWLDHLIRHYSKREASTLDTAVRIALRVGLYQLRFMSRVPPSAAVNESVNLVRAAGVSSAGALVNAVLRRAAREPEYDPVANISDPVERLAVESSHPLWLLQRWTANWGFADAAAFAHANNEIPPLAFRVVNQSANNDALENWLKSNDVEASRSAIAEGAWRARGKTSALLDLAANDQVYIQDEASQLIARVLGAMSGDRILDVCAAPGGKTTQIASLGGPSAKVVAGDLHQHRLRTIRMTAQSQSLSNIQCVALDGLDELPFPSASFDRVLVDAPCTGTGTFRRNPEIRWRLAPSDIEDLAQRQLRILLNAAAAVKSGGRLVYSTCSVELEENEHVIEEFMRQSNDFRPLEINVKKELQTGRNTARTWPHRHGTDGFFIAAFQRA